MFTAGIEIFFGFVIGGIMLSLAVGVLAFFWAFFVALWHELFCKSALKRRIAQLEKELRPLE